jgi:hypothetical protein
VYNFWVVIEDNLPEKFKNGAYHPSLFIYAFKRGVLDKLFEEFMQSNIAILGGEVWMAEGDKYFGVIPLKNGDKKILSWKIKKNEKEDWFDFVERSVKESVSVIAGEDLEKKVTASVRQKLYYHFNLSEE